MVELLTSQQMRALESEAIESGAASGPELMERAGRGVVAAVFERWPELARTPHRAVVLCGPGNNGGDGFVIARLLNDWGWTVEVYLFGEPEKLPPDARANHDRWAARGNVQPFAAAPRCAEAADLFVDALFGTGLARALGGELADWARACARDPGIAAKTVAVDIPSGLCSDSGRMLAADSETARAALTVSFHAEKPGHRLAEGPARCGDTVVADIGLEGRAGAEAVQLNAAPAPRVFSKQADGHKYGHGHALVLSGGPGRTGAARMAARGALRMGAGLVTLGVPPAAQLEVAAQVTAVMLRPVPDAAGLAALLEDRRLNALCLGPGLGLGDEKASLVEAALESARAAVLDADALTLLGRDGALFAGLHAGCVLTPHDGEFSRLFPDIAARLDAVPGGGPAYSRVDAARDAARQAGCVVLLKGPDTVIAAPDGRCVLNSAHYDRAAPWLATAGAGDVLAGFIAGLLARGRAPMQAAAAAAWLHVDCARTLGPAMLAEDLPDALPRVLARLER
ncbi:NAD(P)H-hydrate dehydratase [Roseovarius salinarum]|uniref:NAD(P)H-hydrate dehydratase n=1 Tax=Roseovarius salinarum TaxID=1981892 RepID=UPI000C34606B|nr:NAD(P)H-hydrate dehydratase [Roseovarius salinarum]